MRWSGPSQPSESRQQGEGLSYWYSIPTLDKPDEVFSVSVKDKALLNDFSADDSGRHEVLRPHRRADHLPGGWVCPSDDGV